MLGPIAYIGGKRRLAKQIIASIPPHITYVEAFAGGAQTFFQKEPSKVEVLNDLDGEVVNFYRVCQWHHEELIRFLRYWPASRKLHAWMLAASPALLTDVQRAAKFIYLQRNSYGGLIVKQHYHYAVIQRPNHRPERIPEIINKAHERLQLVQIECLPYQEILRRFDRKSTFFMLDPPYWNRKLYKQNFSERDFHDLEERLHHIKGRFLLTLDDRPEVRTLFAKWHLLPVEVSYTAQRSQARRYSELFITNYSVHIPVVKQKGKQTRES
ncbi:MAG TPA: DNA adenine methylase [Candidatus Limnocylindrales bacterium]|nr:DNA adenine methylase [Candidatus Limnocylindrales bacterium]